MTDTKNYFKENLNRLIREKGTTQKEIADFIGVSTPTMNYYVKGINVPRMDKLDKLCTFFGCTRADLLEPPKKHDITDKFAEYYLLLKNMGYGFAVDNEGLYVDHTNENGDNIVYSFKDKEDFCICIKKAMDKYNKITADILEMSVQAALHKHELELIIIKTDNDDDLLDE